MPKFVNPAPYLPPSQISWRREFLWISGLYSECTGECTGLCGAAVRLKVRRNSKFDSYRYLCFPIIL